MRPYARKHVLVQIREQLGLQQQELAVLVGVSTSTIKRVELLSLKLSRGLARRMSEVLGVSMDYLLKNQLSERPVTPSGRYWTKEDAKLSKRPPAFMRLWHLLPTWIVLTRCCKYLSAIRAIEKPLSSAWVLGKYLDRAFNEFMKSHRPKLAEFSALELSDVIDEAEEISRAEFAIHEGGYDERAGVILSIVEGDAESAEIMSHGLKFPPSVEKDLVLILGHHFTPKGSTSKEY
jgi:transcriptional regulator with XRE-family HTH domain